MRAVVATLGGRRATALSLRAAADVLMGTNTWPERVELLIAQPQLLDPVVMSWCRSNGADLLADFMRRCSQIGTMHAAAELEAFVRLEAVTSADSPQPGAVSDSVTTVLDRAQAGATWLIPHLRQAVPPIGKAVAGEHVVSEHLHDALIGPLAQAAGIDLGDVRQVSLWSGLPLRDLGSSLRDVEPGRLAKLAEASTLWLLLVRNLRSGSTAEGAQDVPRLIQTALTRGVEEAVVQGELVHRARTVTRSTASGFDECRRAAEACLDHGHQETGPWLAEAAKEAALSCLAHVSSSEHSRAEAALLAGRALDAACIAGVAGPDDLSVALEFLEDAHRLAQPGRRPLCAAVWSSAIAHAVRRGHRPRADAVTALRLAREAHDGTPSGSPLRSSRAANLANRLSDCVRWGVGEPETPRLALKAHEEAVDLTAAHDPRYPSRASNLATAIATAVSLGVLDEAELLRARDLQEKAYERTGVREPSRAGRASNLGTRRIDLIRAGLASTAGLEGVLELHRESVDLTAEGDEQLPGRIANLAATLAEMVAAGEADPTKLREAVRLDRLSVSLTPRNDPRRPMRLTNLGNRLAEAVAAGLDEPAALAEALEVRAEAYDLTAADHVDRARHASNLAAAILEAHGHELIGSDNLSSAVAYLREAYGLAGNRAARARYAANLGAALAIAIRHDVLTLSSLVEALRLQREAVELTPTGHAQERRRQANLANRVFQAVSLGLEPTSALTEAFDLTLEVYRRTPAGHPDQIGHLANLARRWSEIVLLNLDVPDLPDLGSELLDAVWDRLRASLGHQSRTRQLEELSIVNSWLPLALLKASGPSEAVLAVEATRGHLAGGMAAPSLASDLVEPATAHAYELAASNYARAQSHARDGLIDPDDLRAVHRGLDDAIAMVRSVGPEMQGFGSRPAMDQVRDTLRDDEVAIYLVPAPSVAMGWLSPAGRRPAGAAIVVGLGREPSAIPLPELTQEAVSEAADQLSRASSRATDVAQWLWDSAFEPLLTSATPPDASTWVLVPSGRCGALPLHAAGRRETGWLDDQVTVRVASSLMSLQPLVSQPPTGPDVVAVAGAVDLEFLRADAEIARLLLSPPVSEPTTADETLLALTNAGRAVLAGHAVHSLKEGAGLSYAPPDSSETTTWLTADGVARVPRRRREWAFLSACSTAQSAARLPDEAVGLPTALQVAGFRTVVATSWPVADHLAFVTLARFRQEIDGRVCDPTGDVTVAGAMRRVRTWLRSATRTELASWLDDLTEEADLPAALMATLTAWWRACPDPVPYGDPQDWGSYCVVGH